jgi:hypothetical protein
MNRTAMPGSRDAPLGVRALLDSAIASRFMTGGYRGGERAERDQQCQQEHQCGPGTSGLHESKHSFTYTSAAAPMVRTSKKTLVPAVSILMVGELMLRIQAQNAHLSDSPL